jgi:serine protease AprX
MRNGFSASQKAARRSLLALASSLVLLASLGGILLSGSAASADSDVDLRSAAVHPDLLAQLDANPTGGVTAIVTAWARDGLDDIEAIGVTGTKLKVLPMIITSTLTKAQLDALEASPAVRSVWPEEKYQTHMEDTTWITKARYVWATSPSSGALKGYGITGKGIELAMIDTGFDGLHEDGDNLIEYCDTTNVSAVSTNRRDVHCTPWDEDFNNLPAGACGAAHGPDPTGPLPPPGGSPPSTGPCSNPARGDSLDQDVSHGTHVGGTIVGTGHASGGKRFNHSTIGMAPDAKFRAYSANVALSLLNTQILSSYDDMTYKKEQGYSKVIAVNNSWGGGGGSNYNPADPQQIAFKRAYDAGIVSVFSAGNSGPEHNTLGAQCVSPWVVCVAANTKPDQVVAFSSKGRPSQPSDTNRDGQINSADVQPDNHDRLLGQRFNLGLYRPTLTAPGVAINSMKAIGLNIGDPTSATCREDFLVSEEVNANCYVQAMGTSMSAPHVTGAIGLIGEAFKQERGRVPRPAEIIDILERSANTTKLPGWEAEEQGAGRLDVHQAVRYAKGDITLRRPNFGHPTPPYVSGSYGSATNLTGCTGTLSWTARSAPLPPGEDPPPLATERYGQHFITVAPNTERLRITIRWPGHPTANLYGLLWRPGVNPDTPSQTPDAGPPPAFAGRPSAYFQARAFADQEATGIPTGPPPTYRLVEVRAPEETDVATPAEGGPPPTIPSGKWVLRVYHRAGGLGTVCNASSNETPKQLEGFNYNLRIEMPKATHRPSAKIDSALSGTIDDRFVPIAGRAGYPPHRTNNVLPPPGTLEPNAPPLGHVGYSWEGITNWEVPGSATRTESGGGEPPPDQDTRTVLYLHGNKHATSEPGEAAPFCTGKGETDNFFVGCGPFLLPDPLSPMPNGANYGPSSPLVNGVNDRSPYDPSWVWCLATDVDGCPGVVPARPGPKTVEGPLTVEWWASTVPAGETPGAFSMGWTIRLWADDVLRFQSSRIEATPDVPGVPDRLKAVVSLPRITANRKFVLHIDPNELDVDQEANFVYYDSQNPCTPTAPVGSKCDSLVKMPVVAADGGGGGSTQAPPMPENVRVTDLPANPPQNHPYPANPPLTPALRVAWDAQNPAPARYEVYRSTDPANLGSRVFSGAGTPCTSPQSPNGQDDPNGHDRQGLCYTDTSVSFGTVYYYRVVAVRTNAQNQDVRGDSSEIAYGMPTRYDRQIKLKVDRLYGPQVWEHALVPPSPTPPDTTNTGVNWAFLWDTLELVGPHRLFARSFTQGIGSTKDGKAAGLDDDPGPPPPPPDGGCPDDDDGDGDDDDEDGDDDDNGDDEDDDCEDDDDDEEDEDD